MFQVAVYPGNVLALHVSKPQGFKYSSGQYIYVNCSDVSPFEWYAPNLSSFFFIYNCSCQDGDHGQS